MALTPDEELELINILQLEQQTPQPQSLFGRVGEKVAGLTEQVVGQLPEIISGPLIEAGIGARERVTRRGEAIKETGRSLRGGDILFQAPVQAAGQVVGGALDIAGEALVSPFKAGFRALPTPAQETLRAGGRALAETPPVQAGLELIRKGARAFGEFERETPQAAKTVSSLGNILLAGLPVGKTLARKATGLERKARVQVVKKRKDFINDLISPEPTKKILTEQAARTTEKGIIKEKVVALTPRETKIAKEVNKIKTLKKGKSIQYNRNQVGKQIETLAKGLEKDVRKSSVVLAKDRSAKAIDNSITKMIDENPIIGSDVSLTNMAKNVQRNAARILNKHPNTPLGVLKSRKEFDKWAKGIRKNTFDDTTTNSFKESVKTIRTTMNNLVDEATPSASVKHKLKRQNLLFDALDNIDPKAATEGRNAISRAFNNLIEIVPVRNKLIQTLGTITGVGIVGGSAIFSPIIAAALGIGVTGLVGKKVITSAAAKKSLAVILRTTDKVLATSKNPSLIRQLRADRAVIADLLKNSEEQ